MAESHQSLLHTHENHSEKAANFCHNEQQSGIQSAIYTMYKKHQEQVKLARKDISSNIDTQIFTDSFRIKNSCIWSLSIMKMPWNVHIKSIWKRWKCIDRQLSIFKS